MFFCPSHYPSRLNDFFIFPFTDVGPKFENSKKRVNRLKTSAVWESPSYGDFAHKGRCEITFTDVL